MARSLEEQLAEEQQGVVAVPGPAPAVSAGAAARAELAGEQAAPLPVARQEAAQGMPERSPEQEMAASRREPWPGPVAA